MMSLREPIAAGRTAEIYDWQEGQILKLFRDGFPADSVEQEARNARRVHAAGLPVPAVGNIIEINGRPGLIYERVEGPSLKDTITARLWTLFRSARLLAELHADMHAGSTVPELPSQRQQLERKIRAAEALSPTLREAALKALDKMPDGDSLCHGDFHPDNILMSERGPVIIDWRDATRGNPLADVARSSVLLLGATAPGLRVPWLLKAIPRWLRIIYLRRYFQLRPADQGQFTAWQPIVAAARLSENISELQDWLLHLVEAGLS